MFDQLKLEKIINEKINCVELFKEAMTHPSFAEEHKLLYNNQRLEFLGDAVVQMIFTDYLYRKYHVFQEGNLSKIRASMVNQDALAKLARAISLSDFIMMGRGELEQGGFERNSTLCDAFEALIGAIYLDFGMGKASDFLIHVLENVCPEPMQLLHDSNPKGILQEFTQEKYGCIPVYDVLEQSGPDHNPVFEVSVKINDKQIAIGKANSRKNAEREAARLALKQFKM